MLGIILRGWGIHFWLNTTPKLEFRIQDTTLGWCQIFYWVCGLFCLCSHLFWQSCHTNESLATPWLSIRKHLALISWNEQKHGATRTVYFLKILTIREYNWQNVAVDGPFQGLRVSLLWQHGQRERQRARRSKWWSVFFHLQTSFLPFQAFSQRWVTVTN